MYSTLLCPTCISKALRYGPSVTRGSHSFTCHPHKNYTCLYSPAEGITAQAGTNLYCLVTEAHGCESLAQNLMEYDETITLDFYFNSTISCDHYRESLSPLNLRRLMEQHSGITSRCQSSDGGNTAACIKSTFYNEEYFRTDSKVRCKGAQPLCSL